MRIASGWPSYISSGAESDEVEGQAEDPALVAPHQGPEGPGVSALGLVNELAIGRFGHPAFTLPGNPFEATPPTGAPGEAGTPTDEPGEAVIPGEFAKVGQEPRSGARR